MTISVPYQPVLRDAREFGVVADGVTDDGAALQIAIDTVAGTGEPLLLPGICATSTALRISTDHVTIIGVGEGAPHTDQDHRSASALLWIGGEDEAVLTIEPEADGAKLVDIHLGRFSILGDDTAGTVGLRVKTVVQSDIEHLYIEGFGDTGMDVGAVSALAVDTFNTQHLAVRHVTIKQVGDDSGSCMRLRGIEPTGGNVSVCQFDDIHLLHRSGQADALDIGGADNDQWGTVHIFDFDSGWMGGTYPVGTASDHYGVRFRAGLTAERARYHHMDYCLPGAAGVYAEGYETGLQYPAIDNAVEHLDLVNALVGRVDGDYTKLITIGVGAESNRLVPDTDGDALLTAPPQPGGRLSLSSGSPIMVGSVSGATTVYYEPYVSDVFPIRRSVFGAGGRWYAYRLSAHLTLDLDSNAGHTGYQQSGKNYDIFGYLEPTVASYGPRIATGPAWASDTDRGSGAGTTELTRVNGMLVNAAAITVRHGTASGDTTSLASGLGVYLGTIRMTANGQTEQSLGGSAAGGTEAKLFLYNAYHRSLVAAEVRDSTSSWAASGTDWRSLDGSATNRVSILVGRQLDIITARVGVLADPDNLVSAAVGVGYNSTTSPSGRAGGTIGLASAQPVEITGEWSGKPQTVGLVFVQAIEKASGATTFYGAPGSSQSALIVTVAM